MYLCTFHIIHNNMFGIVVALHEISARYKNTISNDSARFNGTFIHAEFRHVFWVATTFDYDGDNNGDYDEC